MIVRVIFKKIRKCLEFENFYLKKKKLLKNIKHLLFERNNIFLSNSKSKFSEKELYNHKIQKNILLDWIHWKNFENVLQSISLKKIRNFFGKFEKKKFATKKKGGTGNPNNFSRKIRHSPFVGFWYLSFDPAVKNFENF